MPAGEHQGCFLPFAKPQTIKTKPGIQRAGAVIAMPQIANGIPVKNKGFLNALSISRHL